MQMILIQAEISDWKTKSKLNKVLILHSEMNIL